jgi:hypothetical protein
VPRRPFYKNFIRSNALRVRPACQSLRRLSGSAVGRRSDPPLRHPTPRRQHDGSNNAAPVGLRKRSYRFATQSLRAKSRLDHFPTAHRTRRKYPGDLAGARSALNCGSCYHLANSGLAQIDHAPSERGPTRHSEPPASRPSSGSSMSGKFGTSPFVTPFNSARINSDEKPAPSKVL